MTRVLRVMCALLAALLLQLPCAWAQGDASEDGGATPEALAAARKLFGEGKDLEKEGDWEQALTRFETVAKIKMTPQVRFHLALCYENLGRLVDAVNGFELAEQEARALGDKARDVAKNAPKRAEALRARVAQLVLAVEGTIYTSKVYLDGREVSAALFDKPIPVDPGDHLVEVRRDGKLLQSEDVTFEEAERQELGLVINDPKPPPPPDPEPNKVVPDPQPDKPIITTDDPPQWIAYIVAGAGVVSFGVAGIMWGVRQGELNKIAAECEDPDNFKGCDDRFIPTAEAAEDIDLTAKILLGVGAVGVAAGVVLWFVLMPDDDASTTTGTTKARVGIMPSIGGISVIGTF